jgi:hypothetical protein
MSSKSDELNKRLHYKALQENLENAILRDDVDEVKEALEAGAYPTHLFKASLSKNLAILDMLWMTGATLNSDETKKLTDYAKAKYNEHKRDSDTNLDRAFSHIYSTSVPGAKRLYKLIKGDAEVSHDSLFESYRDNHGEPLDFNLKKHLKNVAENPLERPEPGKIMPITLRNLGQHTPASSVSGETSQPEIPNDLAEIADLIGAHHHGEQDRLEADYGPNGFSVMDSSDIEHAAQTAKDIIKAKPQATTGEGRATKGLDEELHNSI